ncbi:hypothetical protein L208DRAFT_1378520 [Tricholoma matsutake]|nr:hypothetical protein L208DRAFT_1378520 [Tricholoma matsutake 945]
MENQKTLGKIKTQFNESEPEDDNDNIEDTCCTAPHSTEDPAARGCNANEKQQLSINEVIQIQRPKGTPGTEWTIAINMGLAGSTKKKEKYNLLKEDWRNIPAAEKVTFFAVCHDHHPFLAKFHNDWAMEAIIRQYFANEQKTNIIRQYFANEQKTNIVRQYFANKRKTNYQKGYLEVPKKYEYLTNNAAK